MARLDDKEDLNLATLESSEFALFKVTEVHGEHTVALEFAGTVPLREGPLPAPFTDLLGRTPAIYSAQSMYLRASASLQMADPRLTRTRAAACFTSVTFWGRNRRLARSSNATLVFAALMTTM
jgi:hypothetical protein